VIDVHPRHPHPTRSLRGARSAFGPLTAVALVLLAALALPAGVAGAAPDPREDGTGPLPWRLGGVLRFTVDGAAFPDSAGCQYEVYVRVPPATLTALADADSGGSSIRLVVGLRPRSGGGRSGSSSQEFTLAPGDSGSTFGKVLLYRFPARPGRYRLSVEMTDLLSHKRGLVYMGRKVPQHRRLEGEVTVSLGGAGREIGEPEFGWMPAQRGAAGAFERGGRAMLPNPDRLYGLLDQRLLAGLVARSGDASRQWHWRARVLDAAGAEHASQDGDGPAGGMLNAVIELDLSSIPAGGYLLQTEAWQEGDANRLTRRSPFEVAWRPETWYRDPEQIVDEMHLILDGDDEERLLALGPGGREAFIDAFWRERDPDPDTGENEARQVYLERVEHANREWQRAGLQPGMFTDMGRVYIRYGAPDEIERQVIPTGDQDLSRVQDALNLIQSRPTGAVESPVPGADQRPWELWIYEEGWVRRPLAAKRGDIVNPKARRRLLFLFVDEQGYGDYRLRFSTE